MLALKPKVDFIPEQSLLVQHHDCNYFHPATSDSEPRKLPTDL